MNQEKIDAYEEKSYKRNIETWKTYFIWSEGGLMVSSIHKKKKKS